MLYRTFLQESIVFFLSPHKYSSRFTSYHCVYYLIHYIFTNISFQSSVDTPITRFTAWVSQ